MVILCSHHSLVYQALNVVLVIAEIQTVSIYLSFTISYNTLRKKAKVPIFYYPHYILHVVVKYVQLILGKSMNYVYVCNHH